MGKAGKIFTLIVLLIIVLFCMNYVYEKIESQKVSGELLENNKGEKTSYVQIIGTKAVSEKRVLANDRYVGDISADSNIVAISEDGSIYPVTKGTVLVDGMLIEATDDSYSIYRVDEPAKSISTK